MPLGRAPRQCAIAIALGVLAAAPAAAEAAAPAVDAATCAKLVERLRPGDTTWVAGEVLARALPDMKAVCPGAVRETPQWYTCRWDRIEQPALERLASCLQQAATRRDANARRILGHAMGKLLADSSPGELPERQQELATLAGDDVARFWRAFRRLRGSPGDPRTDPKADPRRPADPAALADLRSALRSNPTFEPARWLLLVALQCQEHPDEVREQLTRVDPAIEPVWQATCAGRATLASGQTAAAIEQLERAIAIDEAAKQARREARKERRAGKADRQREATTDADALAMTQAQRMVRDLRQPAHCILGLALLANKDQAAATKAFEIGHCRAEQARLAEALGDDFDLLVALLVDKSRDWRRMIGLYEKLGYPDQALALLQKKWVRRDCTKRTDCAEVDAAAARLSTVPQSQPAAAALPGVLQRLQQPRLQLHQERAVPAGAAATGLQLLELKTVGGQRVVFAAQHGKRALAITISRALDPRGEVSAGGYFAYLKLAADQADWSGPYYLGFAERFPYVVQPRSRLPLFDGERVQFEVEVREIDPESITFPPVRLRTKRQARDRYLSIAIADLTRDSDRDGLTDLYEEKIATDPAAADSDRDGVADAADQLPLTPNAMTAGPDEQLLIEALSPLLFGNERALVVPLPDARKPGTRPTDALSESLQVQPVSERAGLGRVVFIVSPRPLFQGAVLPLRTIVVTPEILQAYQAKFGPTYMLRIGTIVFSPDRARAYFDYDMSWRGGSFKATRTPAGWQLTKVNDWIT